MLLGRLVPGAANPKKDDLIVQAELKKAAESLARSEHLVAFTGAGVSTPSGIPDFRSVGIGLWICR